MCVAQERSVIVVRFVMLAALAAGCGRLGFARTSDATPLVDVGADPDIVVGGDAPAIMGPPAMVQASTVVVDSNGVTVTLATPSTPGTLLVATFASNGVNPIGLPPSWVEVAHIGTGGGCTVTIAFEANNPGNETSVAFTQGAGIPILAQLTEWSGVTSSPLDAPGTATSASPTTSQLVQTGTSTTVAGELGVDVFCEDVNSPTFTPGTGWTNLGSFSNVASAPSFASHFQLDLPVGMAIETQTSSVQGKYSAVIATFRPQ